MRAITGLVAGEPGHRARRRAATLAATAPCTARWRSCPRTRPCRPGSPPASSSRYVADLHGVARPRRARRGTDDRRHARRGRPPRRRVQQGHAPAHQGRRRARHRPAGARARRAAQRRRPGAARRAHRAVQASSAPRVARSSSARTCSTRSSGWPSGSSCSSTAGSPRPAATGRSATRWTTGPRHVLVRADDAAPPRRRARRARGGRRGDVRSTARRRRRARRCAARELAIALPRLARDHRRPARSRCARSTTRSRACSGSSCDDHDDARARRRAGACRDDGRASSRSSATRCARASRRAGGRRCSPCVGDRAVRPARPRRRRAPGAGVRQRRRRGHPVARRADRARS